MCCTVFIDLQISMILMHTNDKKFPFYLSLNISGIYQPIFRD